MSQQELEKEGEGLGLFYTATYNWVSYEILFSLTHR